VPILRGVETVLTGEGPLDTKTMRRRRKA